MRVLRVGALELGQSKCAVELVGCGVKHEQGLGAGAAGHKGDTMQVVRDAV